MLEFFGRKEWADLQLQIIEEMLVEKNVLTSDFGGIATTVQVGDEVIRKLVEKHENSCSVCTYEDSIIALRHCDCNYIPVIRKYFNMGNLGCLIVLRRFVMVRGTEDSIFHIKGEEERAKVYGNIIRLYCFCYDS